MLPCLLKIYLPCLQLGEQRTPEFELPTNLYTSYGIPFPSCVKPIGQNWIYTKGEPFRYTWIRIFLYKIEMIQNLILQQINLSEIVNWLVTHSNVWGVKKHISCWTHVIWRYYINSYIQYNMSMYIVLTHPYTVD